MKIGFEMSIVINKVIKKTIGRKSLFLLTLPLPASDATTGGSTGLEVG